MSAAVAHAVLSDPEVRDKLTADVFRPSTEESGLGCLEAACAKVVAAGPIEKKIKDAVRAKKIRDAAGCELLEEARRAGVITEAEQRLACDAAAAREDIIQVDAFDAAVFLKLKR